MDVLVNIINKTKYMLYRFLIKTIRWGSLLYGSFLFINSSLVLFSLFTNEPYAKHLSKFYSIYDFKLYALLDMAFGLFLICIGLYPNIIKIYRKLIKKESYE